MKKRINERNVMEKVFKCDYVYICDNCGKERGRDWNYKVNTPSLINKMDDPRFCSVACIRQWIFSQKADETNDGISRRMDPDFDDVDEAKKFSIYGLSLSELRELLRETGLVPKENIIKALKKEGQI